MQKNLKIFGVGTAKWPALLLFFRGSLPPETIQRVSIIFDYCWYTILTNKNYSAKPSQQTFAKQMPLFFFNEDPHSVRVQYSVDA